jgi:hypothetical protein
MQRKQCAEGLRLHAGYLQATLEWVSAEANKRVAANVSKGVSREAWREIAQRADNARVLHERALNEYVDQPIKSCKAARTSLEKHVTEQHCETSRGEEAISRARTAV